MGHITAISRADRALCLAAVFAGALALGGCGGIEFQGKVFDYMGVSGDRQKPDVRMSERAPLLLPPNLQSLPQPGTGVAVATAREDWPNDPERVRKRIAKETAAKEAQREADLDPRNPYAGKPTLLDRMFKGSKTEQEPIDDVPEPDPTDKPSGEAVATSGPKAITPHVPEAPLPQDPYQPGAAPDSYSRMSGGATPGGVPSQ